jgi:hypothetical protein
VSRRSRIVVGAALLLAAAAVRIYRLDHFSYGLDEILQGFWIQGTSEFFWKSIKFDAVHPPLDYLISRFVESFQPSDAARKLPAVLWGLGTIAAAGLLLGRRAGAAAGWLAALLLVFAPFHVRYSQEFRPYSLGLFLLVLSLLSLDWFLEKPGPVRLLLLFLSCLATAYALYLAALVLGLTAAAMLVEDAFAPDPSRRRAARRFLAWSPLFLALLFAAYLPWWPVVLEASRRPPAAGVPPLSLARLERILSFFLFAPLDGQPLGRKGPLLLVLVILGVALSLRMRGLRFLAFWVVGGLLAIEVLGRIHPHYDFSRRYLPAGLAFPLAAALPIAWLTRKRGLGPAAALLLLVLLALNLRSLGVYFREGRADWRTLARYLQRVAAPRERIFTENQYSQLCVAFYLVGPEWLSTSSRDGREVLNLEGEVIRLSWAWKPGARAWLVLAGEPTTPALREWARAFPSRRFPAAEGSLLHRLEPSLRPAVFPDTRGTGDGRR